MIQLDYFCLHASAMQTMWSLILHHHNLCILCYITDYESSFNMTVVCKQHVKSYT